MRAVKMSFLRRVSGLYLRDRVRSWVIWAGFGLELLLLHFKTNQLKWFQPSGKDTPLNIFLGWCS